MKKIHILALLILIVVFLVVACLQKEDGKTAVMEEIKSQLQAEQNVEKQKPFKIRSFDPNMEEKWMGKAVSYGCYRKGQAPWGEGPTKKEILEDLTIIAKYWNLIRVYNADDDMERILEVIKQNNIPLKMVLGVWLVNETDKPSHKKQNISNTIKSLELVQKFPNIITAVSVGNETQVYWSGHKMDRDDLIRYIRAVRNNTTVPVTTADDYNFWNKPASKTVTAEIDLIFVHIHPLWNGKTLSNTFSWLDQNYEDIKQLHPEKQIVIGEIGWATKYNPDKTGDGEQGSLIKGDVSVEAQEKFLIELDEWIKENKVTTFIFEVFDEPWKGGGENSGANEIEKNWGVFYENRTPKNSFQKFLIQNQKLTH